MPTTIIRDNLKVQRKLVTRWGYSIKLQSYSVYACPKNELLYSMDIRSCQLNSMGCHRIHHNVFILKLNYKIYTARVFYSPCTPKGNQAKFVFTIGFLTAFCPKAMAFLRRN